MITQPTSPALASPPRKIEETTLGLTISAGKPMMFRAVNGRPPMAKTSESELAAAIWPYENGSSTIGVKKSTVCTRARCRSRRYTPASSNVLELTSTLRSNEIGSCGKTCRRASWLNLEAHPAQDESEVSLRICSRDIEVHLLSPVTAVAVALWATRAFRTAKRLQELQKKTGEDRNRTYPATCVATTVLKTARATRHPSLSRKKKTSNVQLR